MDPKTQKLITDVGRYATAKGLKHFLLGIMLPANAGRSEIIIHRQELTTKMALAIALQSVHTIVDMEIETPGASKDEIKVLAAFKEDMNTLVKATDKALLAAQKKAGKVKE